MTRRSAVRASRLIWPLGLLSFLFAASPVWGQAGRGDIFNSAGSTTNTVVGYENRGGATVLVKVFSETTKTRLDRQALIKMTNRSTQTVSWQTTSDQAEVGFGDLPFGNYEMEVSAVGYLTTRKEFQAITAVAPFQFEVVLQKDPAAVDLKVSPETLPSKARKEAKHGLAALKSGKWDEAGKHLDSAYKIAPGNADLNFLLGYVYYEKKQFARAADFLGTATSMSPGNVQALTLLGRMNLEQQDYGRAISNLEKAVTADSDYWVAHDLLGASYLKERKYEKARDEAQIALSKSKGNSPASQLVLGQALVNLGQKKEGVKVLQDFVDTSPKNAMVPQVKALIAELEAPGSTEGKVTKSLAAPTTSAPGIDPLVAAAEPTFSVKPWQPPGIDTTKPSVAAGVTCPDDLIQKTGAQVQELVADVSRIAAIEHLLHEQLDEMGNPLTKETRTFNYVASISETVPGLISVEEYRAEHLGIADFPDKISSSGFATLALVFHPSMRDNFEMVCEGLGDLRGQSTWIVHFRQREDRPPRFHDYKVGSEVHSLRLKGRAWIRADKFQIVRIESELVRAVPEIRLAGEHQVVEYGPVPFTKRNLQLWLPQSAEIYLDFRRHRYYRKHSFDHYMLFSVDSQENRKEPPAPPADEKPLPN